MSTKPTGAAVTRRDRRAAARRAAPAARHRPTSAGRSPIVLITAIVVGIGIVVLAGLFLVQGRTPPTDSAGILAPAAMTPVELADGRSIGKADAPVTLDIWSDFQCPVCGDLARSVEPSLIARYVSPGTLRIVYHDAAFQGAKSASTYDESVESGAGARCAADQGKYWPFHDWLFANQSGENEGAFAAARLSDIAAAAGLDVPAWQACLATGTAQAAVTAETSAAVAVGIGATPTMMIDGQTIVGLRSATDLSTLIEAAIATAAVQ